MTTKPAKVLVIGSGPIIIGQAAEFDYAGTQACKALRDEGVTSVLVNSNPATIMTDEGIADIVYIEPLTVEAVTRVIEQERPDGLLPTLGGQTGLNLAVELAEAGVLERYNVRLLGTPLHTIKQAEDRELFRQLLLDLGEPTPESMIVTTMAEAREAASTMGLSLVVRPAYTLGGTGGGVATVTAYALFRDERRAAARARRLAAGEGVTEPKGFLAGIRVAWKGLSVSVASTRTRSKHAHRALGERRRGGAAPLAFVVGGNAVVAAPSFSSLLVFALALSSFLFSCAHRLLLFSRSAIRVSSRPFIPFLTRFFLSQLHHSHPCFRETGTCRWKRRAPLPPAPRP